MKVTNKVSEVEFTGTVASFREPMMQALNMHYYGTPNANHYVDGIIVPFEHPKRTELENAHHRISTQVGIAVIADLHDDGSLHNWRFKQ